MKLVNRNQRGLTIAFLIVLVAATGFHFYGVRVSVSLRDNHTQGGAARCPMESPIKVTVANYTFYRVSSIDMLLEAWRGKDSTNLLNAKNFIFNRVLNPFESASTCYADESVSTLPIADLKKPTGPSGIVRVSLSDVLPQLRAYDERVKGIQVVLVGSTVTHK
jgi:hypothetical protein